MICVTFLLVLATVSWAEPIREAEAGAENTAYGYLTKIGVPAAERRRKLEAEYKDNERIVGGSQAALGQFGYQGGLIINLVGTEGQAVCGCTLVSPNRLVTAAHCWSDGVNQARLFTVVLGSVLLFSGGYRAETSDVTVHPNWFPLLVRNDMGIIKLKEKVPISGVIYPASLPHPGDWSNTYVGETAVASGFGLTQDGGSLSTNQFLSFVELPVISNLRCSASFPLIIYDGHLCINGAGGKSTCNGDSGGPLVIKKGGENFLIGATSFGSASGCQRGSPAAFARITHFMPFINEHM